MRTVNQQQIRNLVLGKNSYSGNDLTSSYMMPYLSQLSVRGYN